MKVKHEPCGYIIAGQVVTYYIRKIKKHWWSKWEIIMDGNVPQRYELIDGYYTVKL